MKSLIIVFAGLLFFSNAYTQQFYEVSRDEKNGSKVLKGILKREDLLTDTAFHWFQENQKGYKPFAEAVTLVKKNADSLQFVVFSGTWCQDSKFIIPKFYAMIDSSGFSEKNISLIGVDRNKTTIGHLHDVFKITHIPTIVVMKNGKEIGRVIEYGQYGMFDMEIRDILKNSFPAR